jgi:glycosyltransferase involved in cell wall biosynthesis
MPTKADQLAFAGKRQANQDVSAEALVVVVLTQNEETNLPYCLASLNGLACTVVVVDSGSTDRTLEIAQANGANVLHHAFDNYAAQRNWAQNNLPVETPWILHLDADERLTPGLVEEINRTLCAPDNDLDGFLLRKRTVFMGKWIRHGGHYPSYHLRLFRRSRGICEGRLYDQHFVVWGATKQLQNDYLDVVASSLTTWTLRHGRWAAMEAQEIQTVQDRRLQVNANLIGNPIERRRWLRNKMYARGPLFARAFLYWFYRYFMRFGFLDGKEGLIFHFLQGFWFRFLVDAIIVERQRV